jgi:hypothetical protein
VLERKELFIVGAGGLGRDTSCDFRIDFYDWDGSLDLEHSIDAIVHVAGLAHGKSVSDQQMMEVNCKLPHKSDSLKIENFKLRL